MNAASPMSADPQRLAADPEASVFLTANAGSGKTRTLVDRVARLLLRGTRPEAILCVTYTKAAAAEMQRRLFERLGAWAVMPDAELAGQLDALGETAPNLSTARRLFALALETPGGLKVQTIHAFCERLLRRFPLEAGVSPRFTVMEDASAAAIATTAREAVARRALSGEGVVAEAYAHLSVALDFQSFEGMFGCFDAERDAIAAYLARSAAADGVVLDVWRRCGFPEGPHPAEAIEARAVAATDWVAWRAAAAALLQSGSNGDLAFGRELARLAEAAAAAEPPPFGEVWGAFCTKAGEPRASVATKAMDAALRDRLKAEQDRLADANRLAKAARVAEDTLAALAIASAYAETYAAAKRERGALDFADLIARTRQLLTVRADAAWVLFKLDGGIDHVLVDEAQDTAPEQWDIVRELTAEFFAGAGRREGCARTVFAVGDEKQSIYSFQGARPERLLRETGDYRRRADEAGCDFREPALVKSWRSTPEVLAFVDAVFQEPAARTGLRPEREDPVRHETTRAGEAGAVELWPLEREQVREDVDPWLPLDVEAPGSGRKALAERIAGEIKSLVERGEGVWERGQLRRAGYGDVLILVQRRDATFEEIIRALKLAEVPVAGADRLRLSEHIAFQDMVALVRFVLFPSDDLTLAALLRSPFCDVDEQGLYDLAYGRERRPLWGVLRERAAERPAWAEALAFLEWARGEARRPPFDFLSRVLERVDAQGRRSARAC
jgi:ATP-dependent helicase/nuclease subunit A